MSSSTSRSTLPARRLRTSHALRLVFDTAALRSNGAGKGEGPCFFHTLRKSLHRVRMSLLQADLADVLSTGRWILRSQPGVRLSVANPRSANSANWALAPIGDPLVRSNRLQLTGRVDRRRHRAIGDAFTRIRFHGVTVAQS